jgi:GDPmannose 4,6-dehydratase
MSGSVVPVRGQYVVDPELYRPAEVNMLLEDSKKARKQLGWANSVGYEHLVREMVEPDYRAAGVADAVVNASLASA